MGDVAGRSAELAGVGTLAVGKELCEGEEKQSGQRQPSQGIKRRDLLLAQA